MENRVIQYHNVLLVNELNILSEVYVLFWELGIQLLTKFTDLESDFLDDSL